MSDDCRYACSAFPMCGCTVEALHDPGRNAAPALSHIGRRWREEGVLSPEDVIAALAALDRRVENLEPKPPRPERFALADWTPDAIGDDA